MSRTSQQMQGQLAAARSLIEQEYVANFFTYSFLWSAVASLGQSIAQLQIQADSAFMIISSAFLVVDNTTNLPVTTIAATVQLTDQGSGMNLFDRAQPIANIAGTGQLPFIFPIERVLSANSTLTGTLTAGATTNACSYYLSLHGAKIYDYSPPNGKNGRVVRI